MTKRRVAPWHWNWRWRFTDNKWREAVWERSTPWIAAAALLGSVGGISFGVFEGYEAAQSSATAASLAKTDKGLLKKSIQVSNHHHSQNSAQNKVIERDAEALKTSVATVKEEALLLLAYHTQTVALLTQFSTLQKDFNASVGMIPAVAAALAVGQNALTSKLADIDGRIVALCAALPSTVCSAQPTGG